MPTQEFFSFDEEEAAEPVRTGVAPGLVLLPPRHAVLRPELAVRVEVVPSKREQHLEQIRRDMAVLAGPAHYYTGDEEFYRNRIKMHREAVRALDAGSQSPASS